MTAIKDAQDLPKVKAKTKHHKAMWRQDVPAFYSDLKSRTAMSALSLRSSELSIVDTNGAIILERELACDVDAITNCLKGFSHPCVRIGFETGAMSQHLFHGSTNDGFDVVCMVARQVSAALSAMRYKTDKNEARVITQILQTG